MFVRERGTDKGGREARLRRVEGMLAYSDAETAPLAVAQLRPLVQHLVAGGDERPVSRPADRSRRECRHPMAVLEGERHAEVTLDQTRR